MEAGAQRRAQKKKKSRPRLPAHPDPFLHWIGDAGFRDAVARYLVADAASIDEEIEVLTGYGPFRKAHVRNTNDRPITDADRDALLAGGWTLSEDGTAPVEDLHLRQFSSRPGASCPFAAIWAEKLNHHPEWSNVYKTVKVGLTTHDTGGLSDLDAQLGLKMDALASGDPVGASPCGGLRGPDAG